MKRNPAPRPRPAPRPWAIWLPSALAIAGAGLFTGTDLIGLIMGSWDTPAPGLGWLRAGAAGQGVLAVAAVAAVITGASSPRWRRSAVIAAWVIFAAEGGWFVVTTGLTRGS
ncbi:MAG TPA: hypothetical protein VIX86_03720 [Streptosporangiaceae bacterium]